MVASHFCASPPLHATSSLQVVVSRRTIDVDSLYCCIAVFFFLQGFLLGVPRLVLLTFFTPYVHNLCNINNTSAFYVMPVKNSLQIGGFEHKDPLPILNDSTA